MNIVCVICSDLLTPSDDVFYTPCGHIFHFLCLTQWLERSQTCPQCRDRTTNVKIRRIFFNFSNSDAITEDAFSLQDKIDKLKFQILLKEKAVENMTEKNATLEKQNLGLRQEVKKIESEKRAQESAIYGLKDQVKLMREQHVQLMEAEKEAARCRKKMEELKNIQILLDAPAEEVDEMIQSIREPAALITYISVLKRELTTSMNKKREMRTRMKAIQQELTKVSMERNFLLDERDKRRKLEEDLMHCETEKMELENTIRGLHGNSAGVKKHHELVRKRNKTNDNNVLLSPNTNKQTSTRVIDISNNKYTDKQVLGENSPIVEVKSQGVFAVNEFYKKPHTTVSSSLSILAKKPKIQRAQFSDHAEDITYDGMGGHAKYDRFPSPVMKRKRQIKVGSKPANIDILENYRTLKEFVNKK